MQFLTSLFGGSGNEVLTTALALGIVLLLIVIGLWALKALSRLGSSMGRRNRRLAVIDAVPVDSRRRLLIVRRDNVEHLILTGGAEDLVIETGIPVERPSLPVRRPAETRPDAAKPARPAPRKPQPAPVSVAVTPVQPLAEEPAAPARPRSSGIDRLRELGRPLGQRTSFSLRHTGLMRPVSLMEPALLPVAENSGQSGVDSAKTGPQTKSRGPAKLGDAEHGSKTA